MGSDMGYVDRRRHRAECAILPVVGDGKEIPPALRSFIESQTDLDPEIIKMIDQEFLNLLGD